MAEVKLERMSQRLFLFLRFNVVGIAATVTYFFAGIALGRLAGLSDVVVHVCAFILSIVVSYFGHARFVFRRTGPIYALRFAITTAVLFAASTGLTYILSTVASVNGDHIVLLITGIYPLASFISHSAWTFRDIEARHKCSDLES